MEGDVLVMREARDFTLVHAMTSKMSNVLSFCFVRFAPVHNYWFIFSSGLEILSSPTRGGGGGDGENKYWG